MPVPGVHQAPAAPRRLALPQEVPLLARCRRRICFLPVLREGRPLPLHQRQSVWPLPPGRQPLLVWGLGLPCPGRHPDALPPLLLATDGGAPSAGDDLSAVHEPRLPLSLGKGPAPPAPAAATPKLRNGCSTTARERISAALAAHHRRRAARLTLSSFNTLGPGWPPGSAPRRPVERCRVLVERARAPPSHGRARRPSAASRAHQGSRPRSPVRGRGRGGSRRHHIVSNLFTR